MILALFILVVLGFIFWGYPLDGVNFSDFHFYSKELPVLWGLSIVDSLTKQVNYEFLYHNEGLMVATYYVIHGLPLGIEQKLYLVNGLNIGVQLLNVALFTYVLWKLVGPNRLFTFAWIYLLYPFAASQHYWQAFIINNLAATFFLASLGFFLNVEYEPGKMRKNLVFCFLPSLLLLWCSIIMLEYAICLSPLYMYLALYYSNGKTAVLRFKKVITPYTVIAGIFLLTSILPVFLFTGHRLTVMSYAGRYSELAAQVNWTASLVAGATMLGNAALTYASFFFADTLGIAVYPLVDLVKHADALRTLPAEIYAGIASVAVLGSIGFWLVSQQRMRRDATTGEPTGFRFILVLGFLWMALAYFPFTLSFAYPRNVGLVADRINLLGSMGATLVLGTFLCMLRDRRGEPVFFGVMSLLGLLLLLNIQLQKTHYVEAATKERALVEAVLEARQQLRKEGREPIFLLNRTSKAVFPRAQLRQALDELTAEGKVKGVATFLSQRYFTHPTVSTSFHLDGLYLFWCCPDSAPSTFDFYADWKGVARPVVYKWEEPFRLSEDPEHFTLGYSWTEPWRSPPSSGEFRSYSKRDHGLIVMEIGESTFRLRGVLEYAFRPYKGAAG